MFPVRRKVAVPINLGDSVGRYPLLHLLHACMILRIGQVRVFDCIQERRVFVYTRDQEFYTQAVDVKAFCMVSALLIFAGADINPRWGNQGMSGIPFHSQEFSGISCIDKTDKLAHGMNNNPRRDLLKLSER